MDNAAIVDNSVTLAGRQGSSKAGKGVGAGVGRRNGATPKRRARAYVGNAAHGAVRLAGTT
ncbi:hypothetical protein ScoT_15230 [Streptomyces albidoflavus]|uniref:Uncharacterized protein n=1 Tax=Streptomyces albidoflavus TaxID=1886 RepID=A0AA37FBW4_9ACTN|nr:hypothetical protein ScoT_15230 [Streptomyces albidoflavus]